MSPGELFDLFPTLMDLTIISIPQHVFVNILKHINEKINFSLKEHASKNHLKSFDDVTNRALLSSKSLFLNDEQMQFVAEKLQKVISATKQDLNSINQINCAECTASNRFTRPRWTITGEPEEDCRQIAAPLPAQLSRTQKWTILVRFAKNLS